MSYRIKIDGKKRKAALFISQVQKEIQKALIESGKTQQEVATILGVDRSVVNRRLKGNSNLTARSIAEFAYALDKNIEFKMVDINLAGRGNGVEDAHNVVQLNSFRDDPATGTVKPDATINVESAVL
ncbi:helix-turn-helix transcriptional regulator [Phaeobacter sp. QD34_3]|uniref:helix-turn-helix domain-containing protein n=1 Tax=unclassified Phaeobacter TaxID=2621772 RepID=UPI00237F6F01|nr:MULTISPECIES: helix-turn-helix transcriptional regulator [unclassified Phaeobacter]MDE4134549.1 helix-turn-helix transcriptional regulator [Phaeobacter sp. QD34_3]MDE4138208.1 helix-turn-helix transcriptional regulator [Phaeobacter sp. QD34_24]MDE4174295.1 helix-turn-helix transcriptional regulator [Phaeobacter sp. PT47_59]